MATQQIQAAAKRVGRTDIPVEHYARLSQIADAENVSVDCKMDGDHLMDCKLVHGRRTLAQTTVPCTGFSAAERRDLAMITGIDLLTAFISVQTGMVRNGRDSVPIDKLLEEFDAALDEEAEFADELSELARPAGKREEPAAVPKRTRSSAPRRKPVKKRGVQRKYYATVMAHVVPPFKAANLTQARAKLREMEGTRKLPKGTTLYVASTTARGRDLRPNGADADDGLAVDYVGNSGDFEGNAQAVDEFVANASVGYDGSAAFDQGWEAIFGKGSKATKEAQVYRSGKMRPTGYYGASVGSRTIRNIPATSLTAARKEAARLMGRATLPKHVVVYEAAS